MTLPGFTIPARLRQKLEQDPALFGGVLQAVASVTQLLQWSQLPLFPDYTDHGLSHVEAVLHSADLLMGSEAWEVLTPADVAVLVYATLLHDLGMHLTEEGHKALIRVEPPPSAAARAFHDKAWSTLWTEYLAEVSRFDERQIKQLTGQTGPLKSPPEDTARWSKIDRLVVGEFVRRHHPRLAHEIALRGMPTPEGAWLMLRMPDGEIADLAGLVARSHGVALRSTLPYLRHTYHQREFRGVHAVFLMVLVRIADYLQVDRDRAPLDILKLKRIVSPLSRGEWRVHGSVRNVSLHDHDPEAVLVQAQPDDVRSYLRLREWLDGIQGELDVSWAVLGEVYGRFDELSNLGIKLRRVTSNIDDADEFGKRTSYVPLRAAFDVANADVLKLLVGPLYGDFAPAGVRELVQNAVDAVRERRALLGDAADDDESSPPVSVVLDRGTDPPTLTVTDRGIGMTLETVHDYFLRAGASLRRSSAWRREFEGEDGRSKVLRSGRFGVGALAAFLLGDELHVSTRHAGAAPEDGIEFHARLEDDTIELKRAELPAGTSVRVTLSSTALTQLVGGEPATRSAVAQWDWYCLEDPAVGRSMTYNSIEQRLEQARHVPGPGVTLSGSWFRTAHPDYADIQWAYSSAHSMGFYRREGDPPLVVNGIVVRRQGWDIEGVRLHELFVPKSGHFALTRPRLSVFDADGKMPLNLQRTALTASQLPFHKELLKDVVDNIMAWVLVAAPVSMMQDNAFDAYTKWTHPAIYSQRDKKAGQNLRWPMFLSTADGPVFSLRQLVGDTRLASVLVWPYSRLGKAPVNLSFVDRQASMIGLEIDNGIGALRNVLRQALYTTGKTPRNTPFSRRVVGCRVFCHTKFMSPVLPMLSVRVGSHLVTETRTEQFSVQTIGQTGGPLADYAGIAEQMFNEAYDGPGILFEWHFDDKATRQEEDVMSAAWRELFRTPTLSLDDASRQRQMAEAASRLGDLPERLKAMLTSEPNAKLTAANR